MNTSRQRWSEAADVSDIDGVVDREAIRDLVARYNSYGDAGRFEQLEELFDIDAVMELESSGARDVYDGRDSVMNIFIGARERIAGRPDAATPAYVRHYTSTHQIDLVDNDRATGRCYFEVILSHGLDHWGRYIDRYVRGGDGRWRFAHRRAIVDGHVEASWFVGPNS